MNKTYVPAKTKVTPLGRMELPSTYAHHVLNPNDNVGFVTVWEIGGESYVEISGNTYGTIEFTNIRDLYVDMDGVLRGKHAPLRIKKDRLEGYAGVIANNLPVIPPIDVPRKASHMTNLQYSVCVEETAAYRDKDAYVSDLALSPIWGISEDEIPQERIEFLASLWDACHRSIKDIALLAGLSVRQLAMHFAVPRRTAENWSAGVNDPPRHILLMMQEALGVFKRI